MPRALLYAVRSTATPIAQSGALYLCVDRCTITPEGNRGTLSNSSSVFALNRVSGLGGLAQSRLNYAL